MQKKLIVLVAVCMLASTTCAFGVEDAIATLAGFMATIIQKDNLKEMQTCARDADLLVADVEGLIDDVKSLSFAGFFKAIIATGKIIGEAPFVLRDCETLQDDLHTLAVQAEVFTNIGELTERITKNYVWHYTEIMDDIHTANEMASQGHYYGFGEYIADAVFIALQP